MVDWPAGIAGQRSNEALQNLGGQSGARKRRQSLGAILNLPTLIPASKRLRGVVYRPFGVVFGKDFCIRRITAGTRIQIRLHLRRRSRSKGDSDGRIGGAKSLELHSTADVEVSFPLLGAEVKQTAPICLAFIVVDYRAFVLTDNLGVSHRRCRNFPPVETLGSRKSPTVNNGSDAATPSGNTVGGSGPELEGSEGVFTPRTTINTVAIVDYSVTGRISINDVKVVAAQGFRFIIPTTTERTTDELITPKSTDAKS